MSWLSKYASKIIIGLFFFMGIWALILAENAWNKKLDNAFAQVKHISQLNYNKTLEIITLEEKLLQTTLILEGGQ